MPAFTVDSNGKGGACASPLPFSLGQSTGSVPTTGGAQTNFTLNISRADGQQYLSKISAALPVGLVGKIPAVPLCPEPNANAGTCGSESQIGSVSTTVGSGPTPYRFNGAVFLTGPTNGAPYGMTFEVAAVAGPFNLGTVVARTGIYVDLHTARVTVAGEIPTIHDGIPLRMKSLSVAITRQGFLVNPTNCGALRPTRHSPRLWVRLRPSRPDSRLPTAAPWPSVPNSGRLPMRKPRVPTARHW